VTYDLSNRNRKQMDVYIGNQHTTTTYTAVDLNQYSQINGATVSWDNNFNLKTFYGWTYTYDAENRLILGEEEEGVRAYY